MRTRRQKIQLELALEPAATGEARSAGGQGTEARMARADPERPGRAGTVDGGGPPARQSEEGAGACPAQPGGARCRRHDGRRPGRSPERPLARIRFRLLDGTYEPQPVRRVEIPNASDGVRSLAGPTVLDRFIQQAVMQVLQEDWDGSFSDASYGFRPGRSADECDIQIRPASDRPTGHGKRVPPL